MRRKLKLTITKIRRTVKTPKTTSQTLCLACGREVEAMAVADAIEALKIDDRQKNKEKNKMKKINIKAFVLILILVIFGSELFAQTRIRFARGRTSATVSGSAAGYGSRSYVLGARYGQYLSANVSSRNGCVVFSNGATSISYITESGNNYLYLRNRCSRTTTFTMTVSINFGSD